MPRGLFEAVTKGFAGKVTDVTDAIDRLIALKSEEELGLLRQCATMQDEIFAKVIRGIKPGMRGDVATSRRWPMVTVGPRARRRAIYLGGSGADRPAVVPGLVGTSRTASCKRATT